MKTVATLNSDTMAIPLQMVLHYPKPMQYMEEMPVAIPNQESPAINRAVLNDYYHSLVLLLNKYADSHPVKGHTGLAYR